MALATHRRPEDRFGRHVPGPTAASSPVFPAPQPADRFLWLSPQPRRCKLAIGWPLPTSWLVQEGVDLYAVKELLGHSTLVMTERYSHLRKENLISAVRKFERSIEHSGKGSDAPEAGLNRNDLASVIRKG